jgi:hypothetical protein
MSYRSALSNPSITSGSVGTTYSVAATAAVPLASLTTLTIASIVVPAGVYSVNMCVNINLTAGTYIASGQIILGSSASSGSVSTASLYQDVGIVSYTAPTGIDIERISTITIVLTEATKLYLNLVYNFAAGGSITSEIPNATAIPFSLQAIKLA